MTDYCANIGNMYAKCYNKHISLDLPFAQDAFDKVIKPHEEIANFVLSTST